MKINYNDFFDVIAEQNKYNNHNGKIPRSTFINRWHDLTNEKVENIIKTAIVFKKEHNIKNKHFVEAVRRVSDYLLNNSQFHNNVCNPSIRDEKRLAREYGKKFKINPYSGNSIKTDFFWLMRVIAEMFNEHMGIPIENQDSDINKFPLDWDGLDPEWETPTQFERCFDFA